MIGKRSPVKIMLLAGGDLIESFGHPGVWAEDDVSLASLRTVTSLARETDRSLPFPRSCTSSSVTLGASSSSERARTSGRSCSVTTSCIITGSSPDLSCLAKSLERKLICSTLLRRKNIIVVKQLIYNDISSTKVRLFVRRGMSIK